MIRRAMTTLLLLVCAAPALAKGWEVPEYTVRLEGFATPNAFPGSTLTGPDQGLDPAVEIATANRFLKVYKVGVTASAGGHLLRDFTTANYGWFALGTSVRRGRTTVTLDGEYVPKRNKFPTDPEEGGEFRRLQGVLGLRQVIDDRMRVRLEGLMDHEVFADSVNRLRDGRLHELSGQFVVTPVKGTDLRLEALVGRDRTESRKYVKSIRTIGGGVLRTVGPWKADLSFESGTQRYTDAILGDSNFRRRDQWIEVGLRLSRTLRPGLVASFGGNFTDQTSSRIDRNYDTHNVTVGLEWTGGGE